VPVPDEALFCAPCNLAIDPLEGACPGCALPRELDPGRRRSPDDRWGRCWRCRRVPFSFEGATAGFEYGAALADAIVRMKHGRRRYLARRMARLMVTPLADLLARSGLGAGDLALPVPLHAKRLRSRGFNQALELARFALMALGRAPALAPAGGLPRLERNLLHRTRFTRELGHAGPAARLAEVAGAFAVGDTARVRGRRVLVFDDVMTTGATFNACSDALLGAGASEVHVFALARAV
jgi:predicted amidophosphoribosyltransferase